MNNTVKFTVKDVMEYIDGCIRYWWKRRDEGNCEYAKYYIDAFQSVRISIFGGILSYAEYMLKKGEKR